MKHHYFKSPYSLDTIANDVMSKVNPFYIASHNGDGTYEVFSRNEEAYLYVLRLIITNCRRGFIELPFVLLKLYPDKKLHQIKLMAIEMNAIGVDDIAVIKYDGKEDIVYFEQFFTALHFVCDTKMNHQAFKNAYKYVGNLIEIAKNATL